MDEVNCEVSCYVTVHFWLCCFFVVAILAFFMTSPSLLFGCHRTYTMHQEDCEDDMPICKKLINKNNQTYIYKTEWYKYHVISNFLIYDINRLTSL